jgi:hypothetical protein
MLARHFRDGSLYRRTSFHLFLESFRLLFSPSLGQLFIFMLIFTLPDELGRLARSHQALFYDILFHASADAVQTLAQDERFVGGQVGMVGVLHTWGRNLSYHPHVHYVVPGGGLKKDGSWMPSRANFFLPVKALSRIFRAKFRDALHQRAPDLFAEIPAEVWAKEWVVHSQAVGNGWQARIKDIRLST